MSVDEPQSQNDSIAALKEELAALRLELIAARNAPKAINLNYEAEFARLQEAINYRDERIKFLKNTVSWRITEPIRWFGRTQNKTKSLLNMLRTYVSGFMVGCWDAVWRHFERKLKARPERLRWIMRQLGRVPMLQSRILTMDPAKRRTGSNANQHAIKRTDVNGEALPKSVQRAYAHLLSQSDTTLR